jgi:hypothetical protein
MAHPYRKSSPLNQTEYGESRGEGHETGEPFRSDPADKKAFEALSQETKDSLVDQAWKYGKPFFSPKHGVNVDPEDGVLSFRPIYSDNTKLTYDKIDKPFDNGINRLSTKAEREARKKKFVNAMAKTAYDIGSNFLKGAPGLAATMLTPQAAYGGQPTEEQMKQRQALMQDYYDSLGSNRKTPLNIKEKAYEKQNKKMRSEYTSETGKKLGKRLTKGTNEECHLLVDLLAWLEQ